MDKLLGYSLQNYNFLEEVSVNAPCNLGLDDICTKLQVRVLLGAVCVLLATIFKLLSNMKGLDSVDEKKHDKGSS